MSSEAERPVEIRAGSNNAVRIWVNGKEIYFREEYHHGMADGPARRQDARCKAGRNEILIKVCQNEQTDSWAEQWSFQLRICDALGGAGARGERDQYKVSEIRAGSVSDGFSEPYAVDGWPIGHRFPALKIRR